MRRHKKSYDDEIQYLITYHAEGELAATIISREACGLRGEEPNTEETQGLHQPHESQADRLRVAFKGNRGSSSLGIIHFFLDNGGKECGLAPA